MKTIETIKEEIKNEISKATNIGKKCTAKELGTILKISPKILDKFLAQMVEAGELDFV